MLLFDYLKSTYSAILNSKSVEFMNIDLNTDTECFIDPFKIARNSDNLSIRMQGKLVRFFEDFLDNMKNGHYSNYDNAFHEVKPTRLGYGDDSWDGKGIGLKVLYEIFESFKSSQSFTSALVKDIEDSTLFIYGVGPDRLSDMISNIIIEELVYFTREMCKKYSILMQNTKNLIKTKLFFFNYITNRMEELFCELPFDMSNRPIIFVPNNILTYRSVTLKGAYDHYKMGIIPHLLRNKDLFKLLTHTDMKDKQTKYETDELIRKQYKNPVPGTAEFSTMYINNYDKEQESIKIYKEYRKTKIY